MKNSQVDSLPDESATPNVLNTIFSLHTLSHYLFSSIKVDVIVEVQLLILTLSTGIQDAISFPDFRCFASNQTGNTVLLAVALAGSNGDLFVLNSIGLSLALFLAGAGTTGHLGNAIGSRRRFWLLFTNLVQTILVFAAAAVQFAHGVTKTGSWSLTALRFLAFSSGAQVGSSRAMQIPEITTAMATAAWVDFIIDLNILLLLNRPRNRRAGFLVMLLLGSVTGAFMRSRIGSPMGLVVSGIGKTLATAMVFYMKEDMDSAATIPQTPRASGAQEGTFTGIACIAGEV